MIVKNIAILAADTTRSRAYFEALIQNQLLPEHVFLLASNSTLPGQAAGEKLEKLLEQARIPFIQLDASDINSPAVVDAISKAKQEVILYSGYGGVLLRKDILNTGKRFLHVHGGYLPDFKGSTTNYYSLLVDGSMGASSLFLNAEIDSGPVLLRRHFPAPADRTRIDHVYDSEARAKVLIETLKRYTETGQWQFELPNNTGGETYYIIHPVLKHIAILAKN